jgi:hypothetical protein
MALIWKEWREVRWFLFAGLAIFLGFPLLEASQVYLRGHAFCSNIPEGMVPSLGGVFAIFVAVGATSRDLKDKLACFWQSRPVGIWRWAVAKYLLGLLVVLLVCCIPLVMEFFMFKAAGRQTGFICSVLFCHTFTLVLVYSLSFLMGCLIRSAVYATIFSMAVTLLIYFLPMLVPALEGFSILNIMEQRPLQLVMLGEWGGGGPWFAGKLRIVRIPGFSEWVLHYNIEFLRYVVFALTCSAAGVVTAGIAVKRNWRLRVGQKLMFWSLGGVAFLLFLTFAFQVGSNLECVEQIPLESEGERGVAMVACDGRQGVLLLHNETRRRRPNDPRYSFRRFDLSQTELRIGKELRLGDGPEYSWRDMRSRIVWSPDHPEWVYFLKKEGFTEHGKWRLKNLFLCAAELNGIGGDAVKVSRLDLTGYLGDARYSGGSIVLHDKSIYGFICGKLFLIDVSRPGSPEVVSVVEGYRNPVYGESTGGGRVTLILRLVAAEGLSLAERLRITVELASPHPYVMACEGEVVVAVARTFFRLYRLAGTEDLGNGEQIAILEMTVQREPTALERWLDLYPHRVFLRHGLAYVLYRGRPFGGLTVYDVSRPDMIRRVGHYAAPDELLLAIAPLADGNILVGGGKLHIVAPPRSGSIESTRYGL